MDDLINGVSCHPLKIIPIEAGNVLHALKESETSFSGFGEVYFSFVKKGVVKGWKCHQRMVLNIVVPVGRVRFVVFDDRTQSCSNGRFNEFALGPDANYSRLTVQPGLWTAFQGVGDDLNMLVNIASIEHDPDEAITLPLTNGRIPIFQWL